MIATDTYDAQNPFFLHDMVELCGVCNKKLDKKTYSLETRIPNSEPVITVLELLGSISSFNIDTGPNHLCEICFNNSIAAFKFQKQCNKSFNYVTNYLKYQEEMQKKNIPKEEEDDTNDNEESQSCDNDEAARRKIKCKVCHKLYRADYLRSHMRIHTGEKPYQCDVCKKTFTQKTSLTFHMKAHKNDRNYMCNYCGKAFNILGHLKVHLRAHTGERPYKCSYCDMAFSCHNSHRRHLLVHTKEKPYTCEVCAKGFNRMSNLRVHIKIHTNDKKYVCSLCQKAFIQAHSLRSHMETHAKRDVYAIDVQKTEPTIVENILSYDDL